MPFPTDEVLMATAKDLVAQFHTIFGPQPGYRPAHAKGTLLSGTFHATPLAATLSSAPHFNQPSTPILIRFSNSTGLPQIPDNSSNADPRGIAIRFNLGDRKHTDIISHSTPYFPTRTGAEFLDFLRAIAGGTVPQFLESHPTALAFVQAPKPAPESYAQEEYFGVTAMKLVDKDGKGTFVRWRVVPDAGVKTLSEADLKEKDADYLQKDIVERVSKGNVKFKLRAQVAEEGDVTDNATVRWPESRKLVELGEVVIEKVVEGNAAAQKNIIFDPIPRIQGVEPSDDPLLEMRAAVYLVSGKERRAA